MSHICIYDYQNPIPEKLFDELFSLMLLSFPPDERRTKAEHYAEFSRPPFHSLCCIEDGLQGFMSYWDFGSFVYLEHFAVQPSLRGKGLGFSLMQQLRSHIGNRTLVLEAEPPELNEKAARRVGFYNRLGFSVNEYTYYQPPITDDQPPVRLIIMSAPERLSPQQFAEIRGTIYRDAYEISEDWTP